MDSIYKKVRAKINLTLNVLNKRDDGFHNIESVFHRISMYDELYVQKVSDEVGIVINSNVKCLENEENIIFKAYNVLKERFDNITGVKVTLNKNIPMQARTSEEEVQIVLHLLSV